VTSIFVMTWSLTRVFVLPLALIVSLAHGLAYDHPGAPYTRQDLDTARTRAVAGKAPWTEAREHLLLDASEALKLSVTPPPAKLVIPRRYADAVGHMKAREKIGTDAWAAQALALGAWMADDKARSEAYAKKAIEILMAWTACGDMGHLSDDQKEAALVSCATGNGLIVAADLLYENPLWAKADREKFLRWVKASYLPATEIRTIGYGNNWECWGIYATLLASHLLDDLALFAKAEKLLLDDIEKQISDDGSMPKELARGSGKHWYTYYALTPMILGAKVVEDASGKKLLDLATPSGKRIASAIAYFLANLESTPYRDLLEGYGGLTNNETLLKSNLSSRPITGNRAHSAWNFPTLFLRPEVVPVNRPPEVAVSPPPPSVKPGTEFVLDAAASSDPDGRIREILWTWPVEPKTTTFDNVLRSPTDVVEFKEPLASDFTLSFTLKMNRDANAALGLQSDADTVKDWGGSSFLLNTKDGLLKVRDGARYRAENDIRCQPGTPVKIRMVVSPLRQTCDVYADTGSGEVVLAHDYAIREDKKMRSDIRRVRYVGDEGAEISDIALTISQRTQKGPMSRFVFDRPGTYRIQLIAIDNLGAKATRDIPVTVAP
jgi:hypothetical protein